MTGSQKKVQYVIVGERKRVDSCGWWSSKSYLLPDNIEIGEYSSRWWGCRRKAKVFDNLGEARMAQDIAREGNPRHTVQIELL